MEVLRNDIGVMTMVNFTDQVRPAAVAGAFYPADPDELRALIAAQLDMARGLLDSQDGRTLNLPDGAPKAVIVPHAGYVFSGTTAALAYALLERGRGTITRAVIVGPTHRVPVRGVAMSSAAAFATPLGLARVDQEAERRALNGPGADALCIFDRTHAQEHAVEVQVPWLQTVLGSDVMIVPLNAGDALPEEVGDVLRALWGGSETVIIISSDLSHYHPQAQARALDDSTIGAIATLRGPITPTRACGAYPVNGLLDVCVEAASVGESAGIGPDEHLTMRFLGCATSGDREVVALADAASVRVGGTGVPAKRPPIPDVDEPVVGYASFGVWQSAVSADTDSQTGRAWDAIEAQDSETDGTNEPEYRHDGEADDRGPVLFMLARSALRAHLGISSEGVPGTQAPQATQSDVRSLIETHPWLQEPGASFVTLTEEGRLRGCIGSLEAFRPLGEDVAAHAVDAAVHDPRFAPVTADEYPRLAVEVSVLSKPEEFQVHDRDELERTLTPGVDGLIIDDGRGRRATFLPQVWDELPGANDFVTHLLAKAGLPPSRDWWSPAMRCWRYSVSAYQDSAPERAGS